jgi:flagellar protein FlgJ
MRGTIEGQLAIDANALARLKAQAREDPRAGVKAVAQQFEAIFLQILLKSMRDSVSRSGFADSSAARTYEGLLDQQLVQKLAARGATGLAPFLEKQLVRQLPVAPEGGASESPETIFESPRNGASAAPAMAAPIAAPVLPGQRWTLPVVSSPGTSGAPQAPAGEPTGSAHPPASPVQVPAAPHSEPVAPAAPRAEPAVPAHVRAFVERLWPHAAQTARATGIPPHFLIAQAALETGWGRAELRGPEGSPSYNLFNIKAGRNWDGAVIEAATTEYEGGVARRQTERFRAYGSYGEAFADYARLLRTRYGELLGTREAGAFARGLQRAGYATDPMYAEKLTRIIDGATLRAGLAG